MKFEGVLDGLRELYAFVRPSDDTLSHYFRKIMELAVLAGKARRRGGGFLQLQSSGYPDELNFDEQTKETELFRAHAPVNKVEELASILMEGPRKFSEIRGLGLRNAVYALNTLGLSSFVEDEVVLYKDYRTREEFLSELAGRAKKQDSVIETRKILSRDGHPSGKQIGTELSLILDLNWSPVTCARYGSALKLWAFWLESFERD